MLAVAALFTFQISFGQYTFEVEKSLDCTEVKSQDRTGTCWSFATSSFLESELIRQGNSSMNLSEMYVVRMIYKDKARNYVLRQGNANFSQGSLAHDVVRVLASDGVVPESVYPGREDESTRHDHSEMERVMKGALDGLLKKSSVSDKWPKVIDAILDIYLGELPESFEYDGKTMTPASFAKELGLTSSDFINITSFSHHPFYEKFILEIPDNYSNGSFYNVPIDDLMKTIDASINAGYTVAWDGDVSEKGFSQKNGVAILPIDSKRDDLFDNPGEEINVTQENRQANFENLSTTDDHLMHLTGIAHDQEGTKYYIVKNSWGNIGPAEGFIYISEDYIRMKTISIMVNQEGIPSSLAKKINL
jgi:bleomycin hydrolase